MKAIPKSIIIISRAWFDRVNGNSYYSAHAILDGVPVAHLDHQYGYGAQIEIEMFAHLDKLGYITLERSEKGRPQAPYSYCEWVGCSKMHIDTPVSRKGLLDGWTI